MKGAGSRADTGGMDHAPLGFDADALTLRWVPEGETRANAHTVSLAAAPGSRLLREQLGRALESRTRPTSTWRTIDTVRGAYRALRAFLRWCAENNIESLEALGGASFRAWETWAQSAWQPGTAATWLRQVRMLLQECQETRAEVRFAASGRLGSAPETPLQPTYTLAEFREIKIAARRAMQAANRRIRASIRLIEQLDSKGLPLPEGWSPPGETGTRAAVADAMTRLVTNSPITAERNDLSLNALAEESGISTSAIRRYYPELLQYFRGPLMEAERSWRARANALRRLLEEPPTNRGQYLQRNLGGPPDVQTALPSYFHYLMLTPEEGLAALTLLMCQHGANLSTIEGMRIADERAGEGETDVTVFTAHLVKRRRGRRRFMTEVYVDGGQASGNAGRAYRYVKESTDPSRYFLMRQGVHTDLLCMYYVIGPQPDEGPRQLGYGLMRGTPSPQAAGIGIRELAWWIPDGVHIDFQKLHRTFQTRVERRPAHNTEKVHLNNYLGLDAEYRAEMRSKVAEGFEAAVSKAEEDVRLRVLADSAAPTAALDGAHDTATAACLDFDHHPETHTVCTESFLMCLACENAVATPRHLPRLALIYKTMTDLRAVSTAAAWAPLATHYERLTAFLFRVAGLAEDEVNAYVSRAKATDRRLVEELLMGDLDV